MHFEKKLVALMTKELNVSEDDIINGLKMGDIEEWDSLGHIGLIVKIETEFDLIFDPEDLADLISYKSIINKIKTIKQL